MLIAIQEKKSPNVYNADLQAGLISEHYKFSTLLTQPPSPFSLSSPQPYHQHPPPPILPWFACMQETDKLYAPGDHYCSVKRRTVDSKIVRCI